MLWDHAHRQELRDLIGLELKLLEMYRAQVHHQSETASSTIEFVIGDVMPDGRQRGRSKIELADSFGAEQVREVLQQFRALAFLAAFRTHDMIVGWILMANGLPARDLFRFAQKKGEWNRLAATGTLQVPPELADPRVLAAQWQLYENLEKVRSALTHEGMVQVLSNGTIDIEDNRGKTHLIDDAAQSSYLRLVALLAAELVGVRAPDELLTRVRELDLGRLQPLHGVTGFSPINFVYDHVIVRVPEAHARALAPYSVEIDFAHFDAAARQARVNVAHIFSLDVIGEATGRTLTWRFPSGEAPRVLTLLDERDAKLLPYLSIVMA